MWDFVDMTDLFERTRAEGSRAHQLQLAGGIEAEAIDRDNGRHAQTLYVFDVLFEPAYKLLSEPSPSLRRWES